MNSPQFHSAIIVTIDTEELVRGQEHALLERMRPLAREQNLTLDLRKVQRIDAAGLAALITLYCDACKAGYQFRISNPSHHVAELLSLVRLDGLLAPQTADGFAVAGLQLQESVA
jgi:anti-anti-sigma factor